MEKTVNNVVTSPSPKKKGLISVPLLKQSLKANKTLFLIVLIGMSLLITVINVVLGKGSVFTKIDMDSANAYMERENLSWLVVLGLFQTMGFGLNRLAVMSSLDMSVVTDGLIYGIAHSILPLLYTTSVAVSLVSAQVDNGSMAYVLSTPTNRKQVVITQALFLFGSIFVIYLGVTVVDMVTHMIGNFSTFNPLRTFLLEFGSCSAMIAIGGIAFMASCVYSRARKAMAIGGGIAVWCFLAAVLGLFGSKTFVSLGLGVESMNVFNFLTLFTLFDTNSIDTFSKFVIGTSETTSLNWIWELVLLWAIGISTAVYGIVKFQKKDLLL